MSILLCISLLITQTTEEIFLPKWMTAEESLRVHEIGKGHVITAPPGGWVETPAEYERLRGVFVTWIWFYSSYRPIFREIVRETAEVCKAYIITSSSDTTSIKNYLISNGVPLDSVEFYTYPYNSIWIRDYGPWFIRKQDNTEGIVDFQYNRPRPSDDTIPWRIGQSWGIPVYGSPLEHPGGNFMVDGLGTGFASHLIYQENPSYTPEEIDTMMLDYSGLEQFIPLRRMLTEYTGHIDLWTKLLDDTLVLVGEYATGHPNDTVLDNRADSISRCKNREGFPYRVARMPMPWSMSDAPPTYLNSLTVNNKILVPLWNELEDDTAQVIYQQLMPGYQVIGINCSAMSGSGGAIHCITMQIPSSQYLHIQHQPLVDTNDTLNPYRVRARIITSNALFPDSTLVFYRVNGGSFSTTPLSAVIDTPGVYAGYIPAQSSGDTIDYYLLAENNDGIRRTSPYYCPPHMYSFAIGPDISVAEKPCGRTKYRITAYPNPAKQRLTFAITTNEPAKMKIEIYNALGQKVKLLFDRRIKSGDYTIQWDFCDNQGKALPQGAYFYRIVMGEETKVGKILLTK
jgi:agmatine/peptidylarginine deiminase